LLAAILAGIGLAAAHGAGRRRGGARQRRHLTQRILAFSRRQPLSPRRVRLSELVDGMSELIRHSVGEKIQLETHLNAQRWTRCDVNQMENVIHNLALNARDARMKAVWSSRPPTGIWPGRPGVTDFVPGDLSCRAWPFHDLRLCASIVWVSEDRKPSWGRRDGHDPHAVY
jgi:hypothetical protein